MKVRNRSTVGYSAAIALCVLPLGGCVVTPSPIAEDDLSHLAAKSIADVAKDQEPIAGPVDLLLNVADGIQIVIDAAAVQRAHMGSQGFGFAQNRIENTAVGPAGFVAKEAVKRQRGEKLKRGWRGG